MMFLVPAMDNLGIGGGDNYDFFITPSTETPIAGVTVDFECNPNPAKTVASYSWSMGDGTIPYTIADPSHYFVGLGPYTVSVTVTYTDNSTDSDTQTITPTAPSATAGMTRLEYEPCSATISNASPATFDYFYGTVDPVSSGAKLASATNVGYSSLFNDPLAFGRWAVGAIPASGTYYQIGAWFKFSEFPTGTRTTILGFAHQQYDSVVGTLADGIAITSAGALQQASNGNDLGKTVPLNTWVWLGCSIGEYASFNSKGRLLYKEIGSAVEVLANNISFGGFNSSFAQDAVIGSYKNATYSNSFKLSGVTLHSHTTLTGGTYPNDIIPPQEQDYIYRIEPVSGSDSNDGVSAAWLTTSKANEQMQRGLDSHWTDGVVGSGPWLTINTDSNNWLDVGVTGLQVRTPGMWVKHPTSGQKVRYKPHVTPAPSDWTVTGGYTGIYQLTMAGTMARVWCDDVLYASVASLALLDAAITKTSCVVGNTLYIKPDSDPRSDGKSYVYSRIRPIFGGDPVGFPVVSIASRDVRVTGIYSRYGAINNGGSYFVGDVSGFSGKCLVEDYDLKWSDKHSICWTMGATDSEITTRDGNTEAGLAQPYTDYMVNDGTQTGNVHNWINANCVLPIAVDRSSSGVDDKSGISFGTYYSHGSGLVNPFEAINITDCDFGNAPYTTEGNCDLVTITRGNFGFIDEDAQLVLTNATLGLWPSAIRGMVMTGCTVQMAAITSRNQPEYLGGDVTIDDCVFNLDFSQFGTTVGLWRANSSGVGTAGLNLTFTNNVVKFPATSGTIGSRPVFDGMVSADIVSCNNNTYYIPAGAVFARNFNAGGGAQNYTFAQWQALGYDTNSTRLDPV